MDQQVPFAQAIPIPVPYVGSSDYSVPSNAITSSFSLAPINQNGISEDQIKQLEEQGFTRGLAQAVGETTDVFPLRIWIVDNSGSMTQNDGHRFVETSKSSDVKVVSCTRWKEIQETVEYHARMAALLKAPTIFRLLNKPENNVCPPVFGIADKGEHLIDSDLQVALRTIMNTGLTGVTPLCRHIYEIRDQITILAPQLQAEGRKVSIIIATDGLPTDEGGYGGALQRNQFISALRSFEGLPVWIVIRLCTDEDSVVKFYNDLDSQLELSIEVLDDFMGEAKKVYNINKWLTYSLPLHRCREMGFHHGIFHLFNERKFTKGELRDFCMLLLGKDQFDGVVDPEENFDKFSSQISKLVKKEKKQWNPHKRHVTPIIDIDKYRGKLDKYKGKLDKYKGSGSFRDSKILLEAQKFSKAKLF